MTPEKFETLLDNVVAQMTKAAQNNAPCLAPKAFEEIVKMDTLKTACKDAGVEATPTFHPHAFPDLLANGYGVEVKHTTKDTWLAVGNSIFEGMRDQDAQQIYVIYGKMGGWPEVRWKRYEDCVSHVRVSHSPRFVIEMDGSTQLFRTMDVSYPDFCALSPEDKMAHVRRYAQGRLREGERLWWLEDREEQEHSLPIAVTVYRTLPEDRKRILRAEATLLCPEVVKGGRSRGKYDRAGLYLITQHGVFAPQLRDLFSAGSVGARMGERGHKYIITAIRDIESQMRHAAANLDERLIQEYWKTECEPGKRIKMWLSMADEYAPDWTPSKVLFING